MSAVKVLLLWVLALLLPAGAMLQAEGCFKSARAACGAVGLAIFRLELLVELYPIRQNRTYYRLAVGRAM